MFPSKDVQDFANTFRKRYDPHYTLIQPHMTIHEAEEWDKNRLNTVVQHLDRVTQELSPFSIHFNRFSSFYPVSNVIYLALSDPEPFQQLHQSLCQGVLLEENRPYLFNPHLTIGQGLGSDEFHDVLASVMNVPVDLHVTVDRLHLLYQTENGAWTAHQTFLLRK